MPNRTIYIRKDDIDKWDAIESKPEWLHERLNEERQVLEITQKSIDQTIADFKSNAKGSLDRMFSGEPNFDGLSAIVDDSVSVTQIDKIYRTNYDGTYKEEMCPLHYQPKGSCMVKGCKYGKGKK